MGARFDVLDCAAVVGEGGQSCVPAVLDAGQALLAVCDMLVD